MSFSPVVLLETWWVTQGLYLYNEAFIATFSNANIFVDVCMHSFFPIEFYSIYLKFKHVFQ